MKNDLIEIIRDLGEATCAEVCDEYSMAKKKQVDSASVSTALFRMVQQGIMRYSDKKGPKGGHVYMLAIKQTRRLVFKLKINESESNN